MSGGVNEGMISVQLSKPAWDQESEDEKPINNINEDKDLDHISVDPVLRAIAEDSFPTKSQATKELLLLIIVPLIFQFVYILIPLEPPVSGVSHNLAFVLAYTPLVVCSAAIGNLYSIGYILNEPTRWSTLVALFVVAAGTASLLAEYAKPYPLLFANAFIPAFLMGMINLAFGYSLSPNKGTKEFNAAFNIVLSLQRHCNGQFFVAIGYLVAFFKTPYPVVKFIMTMIYHVFVWVMENSAIRKERERPFKKLHFTIVCWFLTMDEVFTTLTFPVISSVYFAVFLAFKIIILARYPFLLTDKMWELTLATKRVLENPEVQFETFSLFDGMEITINRFMADILWYFLPTSYTKEEYHHRVLVTFFFNMYSYIWSPAFYMCAASFFRYGYNQDYYSFKDISHEQFTLTLIYSGASIIGLSITFFIIAIIIKKQWNYSPFSHGLYKLHHFTWYMIFMMHNATTFTVCLLLKHVNVLYDVKSW